MISAAATGLRVEELGRIGYGEAMRLQRGLVDERARGAAPDTLLLLEHPHVVTLGRGYNGRTLGATRHPVVEADRGGDVTYHGPGQLVGYPIVHLGERGLTVGRWLRLLEDALLETAAAFGVGAFRVRGFTGVWASRGKLASIGVGVRSWVAYHGFALNVSTDLSQFSGLYPCGLEPGRMTSLERLLGTPPDPALLRREVSRALAEALCRAC